MKDALAIILGMTLPQLLPLGMWWWLNERKQREARKDAHVREF